MEPSDEASPNSEPPPPKGPSEAKTPAAPFWPPADAVLHPLPEIAKKHDDLEAIKKAVEDAASVSGPLWLSYLFALFYIALAAAAVNHVDLLLENPVKLPFLNIELALKAFFVLAPILFVILHAYTLAHFVLLSDKAKRFHQELQRQIGAWAENGAEIRKDLRRQLPSNIFVQFLAGPEDLREGWFGRLLTLIAWVTLVGGPVLLLLLLQLQFLPYHSSAITWVVRGALLVDLILIWWLVGLILSGRSSGRGWWGLKPKAAKAVSALASLGAFVLSWLVFTFPGEWGDVPYRLPIVSLLSVPATAATDWVFGELENPGFGRDPRSRTWPANRLRLREFNIYEALKVKPDDVKWRAHTFDLQHRHLEYADLSSSKLDNIDLRYAQLQNVSLFRAQLQAAWFDGAQLRGASLGLAELQGASLVYAQLQGASLDLVRLQGAFLAYAQLQRASLDHAQLQGASLHGTELQGASLKGAQLQGTKLDGAELQGARLDDAQLQGARLDDAQLQGSSLDVAQLQGASLNGAKLQGASLVGAQLQGASVERAQLQGVSLDDAYLQGASLVGAKLQGASLEHARLQGASLHGAHLQGASLEYAQLQGASLDGGYLQGASLEYAQLQGALLSDVQLQGASLNGAQLQGASLSNALLWRSDWGALESESVAEIGIDAIDWTAVWREGAWAMANRWNDQSYGDLRKTLEIIPEGSKRGAALKRVDRLDCKKTGETLASCYIDANPPLKVKEWRRMLEATRAPDAEAYQRALDNVFSDLLCGGDANTIYVLRGLAKHSRYYWGSATDALAEASFEGTNLIEKILKGDCPVSAALTAEDRAKLLEIKGSRAEEAQAEAAPSPRLAHKKKRKK
jgi:uncharacterized protein YjbI with pentapeptide repeats